LRKTKIVCTIGPASDEKKQLLGLIKNGMDIARLNFSHGSREEHKTRLNNIFWASEKLDKPVAIMMDTRGPEIRIGSVKKEPLVLKKGDNICLTVQHKADGKEKIAVSAESIFNQINIGESIYIDDGLIELKAINVTKTEIYCEVIQEGRLYSYKGLNIPGVSLDVPFISEQDKKDLMWSIKNDVDFIAVSFVNKAEDLLAVRNFIKNHGVDIQLISKIESAQGVDNLKDIISVSDGIMLARGDLGVEVAPEKVPIIQKRIIKNCNQNGKPVITATQMMESMIESPRPTRAEASDVANAVLDGSDAVMLSGETAIGNNPLLVVKIMGRIIEEAEMENSPFPLTGYSEEVKKESIAEAVGTAACSMIRKLDAKAIISATRTGYTARMIAKNHPNVPIIATTPNRRVRNRLLLSRGVYPVLIKQMRNTDEVISQSVSKALDTGIINNGDLVIITAGLPTGIPGTTRLLEVHRAGESIVYRNGN